jgi:hypothetical protein
VFFVRSSTSISIVVADSERIGSKYGIFGRPTGFEPFIPFDEALLSHLFDIAAGLAQLVLHARNLETSDLCRQVVVEQSLRDTEHLLKLRTRAKAKESLDLPQRPPTLGDLVRAADDADCELSISFDPVASPPQRSPKTPPPAKKRH